MRTTLVLDDNLVEEVKILSGEKTKKKAIESALREYVERRKTMKFLDLEGKIEFTYTLDEFLERRNNDLPR